MPKSDPTAAQRAQRRRERQRLGIRLITVELVPEHIAALVDWGLIDSADTRDRVHLLADDVGSGPDRADEQIGRLEDRRADLPKPVAGEPVPRCDLEELPATDFLGKDVVHAAEDSVVPAHGGRLNTPAFRGQTTHAERVRRIRAGAFTMDP